MPTRILVFMVVLFISAQILKAQNNHTFDQFEIQCKELPSSVQYRNRAVDVVSGQTPETMLVHWHLNPFERFIKGELEYTFHYNPADSSNLSLRLSSDLAIDSIYTGQQVLQYQRLADLLVVALPAAEANEILNIAIHYSGIPPSNGFGSFVTDYSFDNNPVLWTLSEPDFASDWWPCPAARNVKLDTVEVFTHTPPEFFAAGNGRLESIDSSETEWIHHWKSSYPIAPYLIATAIMKYVVVKDEVILQNDTLPILDYIFGGSMQEWAEAAHRLKPMLLFYDSLFVHYPFIKEKYGHAQFNWGGGMEHQTMSFMAYPGEALTAHELAHQWFGNYITCGSWKEIWLNEGFATYLTGLYYERFRPAEFINWRKGQVESITSELGGSVYVEDTLSITRVFDGRLSYSKAAMVLHMLRNWIGDVAFFNGIRSYLNDDSLKYDYSTTLQLRQHFEQTCNCDLAAFFNVWIYEEGYPSIDVKYSTLKGSILIEVKQQSSLGSGVFYEFSLPVKLNYADSDTLIWLKVDSESRLYTINTASNLKSFDLDPYFDVVASFTRKSVTINIDAADVILFPNPSQNELRIKFSTGESLPLFVQITDIAGRSLGEFRVLQDGLIDPKLQETIDSGIYCLTFTLYEKKIQKRFVLVKK